MEAMCHTSKQCNINLSGKQKGVQWGEKEKKKGEGKVFVGREERKPESERKKKHKNGEKKNGKEEEKRRRNKKK